VFRPRSTIVAIAAIAALAAAPAADAAAARHASAHPFAYHRTQLVIVDRGTEVRDGATIHDITYAPPGGVPVSAYLVEPTAGGDDHAGIVFAHWFEPPDPSSSRLEFLDEAVSLAGRYGVVSVLPQLGFPWNGDPDGTANDATRITAEVITLRRALDLLRQRPDVDRHELAYVGHDYGAMFAILAAHADRHRVRTAVFMAPDATFCNWFDTFWLGLPEAARRAYCDALAPFDPIAHVGSGPRGGVLLQFAADDFFIPHETALAIAHAAVRRSVAVFYPTNHQLADPAATAQRDLWLGVKLGFLSAAGAR
jgi:pimeloyl-ACP methyl ester carboxylesterase